MEVEQNVSLFEVDENGVLVYEPVIEEGESVSDGSNVVEDAVEGDSATDSLEGSEVPEKEEEIVVYSLGDGDSVPVVLSDEVTQAIIEGMAPSGGSLGSSTLDYFDRVVSSLPSDYKYIAYRTSSDSSYDGVLYYGDDYEVTDNCISFGDDAKQLHVQRVNSSGYNNVVEYESYDASNVDVYFSQSGDVIYYTNAEIGYPLLGSVIQPIGFAPLLVVGLVSSLAVVVLQKLFLKR